MILTNHPSTHTPVHTPLCAHPCMHNPAHTPLYAHPCMHTPVHTSLHAHPCVHTPVHTPLHAHPYTHTSTRTHLCAHPCMCNPACAPLCTHTCNLIGWGSLPQPITSFSLRNLINIKSWFFPTTSLKRLRAARIDQLADSNEPAKIVRSTLLTSKPQAEITRAGMPGTPKKRTNFSNYQDTHVLCTTLQEEHSVPWLVCK